MSADSGPGSAALTLSLERQVNAACDRFEAAWQAGGRPRLEDYLADCPGPARAPLLAELLLLELTYRGRAGEGPAAEEYHARLPGYGPLIDNAFRTLEGATVRLPPGATREPPAAGAEAALPAVPGYEVLAELGRGGMGVVYKARHVKLGRLVALKMILVAEHAGPEERARFQTEAEAVARLLHPNIVQIYEVGEQDRRPFLALEFCAGGSLEKKLGGVPLPAKEAARLAETLARAMHTAHEQDVIHRDLKPANILLAQDRTPKVTDFGLAKKLDEAGQTATGVVMGTPSYMAPEQADGKTEEIGPLADVYALGAILYECLTGRPPFRAATVAQTLQQVIEVDPVPPRQLNPESPRDLETVCLKCLRKDPQRRYHSAAALADDLRRWLDGKPILARPVSAWERFRKWARRRPSLAALAVLTALLVLVTLVGVAGVTLLWQRAEEADTRTQRTAYVRTLALAHVEWRDGNLARSDELLDACPAELRGWEWHYLRRLFRVRHLATLRGHAGPVNGVAFSPDGTRLASASADGSVRVWDRQAHREMLTLRGHEGAVLAVAFSPDGGRIASGGADHTARLWDREGHEVLTLRGHTVGVASVAFSPDGTRLATGGGGKSAGS
jgi:tRNA A-37 threonylcarbamoyl transferase component Bud32